LTFSYKSDKMSSILKGGKNSAELEGTAKLNHRGSPHDDALGLACRQFGEYADLISPGCSRVNQAQEQQNSWAFCFARQATD
jgi:hypothetical protein